MLTEKVTPGRDSNWFRGVEDLLLISKPEVDNYAVSGFLLVLCNSYHQSHKLWISDPRLSLKRSDKTMKTESGMFMRTFTLVIINNDCFKLCFF